MEALRTAPTSPDRVKGQLEEGHAPDQTMRKRSGRRSDFTPSKIQNKWEAQRIMAWLTKGKEYGCDVTIDHRWYQNWYAEAPLPTIERKMPWLQEEDATPPTLVTTLPIKLNSAGREGGWDIKVVMQPA